MNERTSFNEKQKIRLTHGFMNIRAPSPPLREVMREALSQRIRQRAQRPFSVWDQKVRLSIPGEQDKTAMCKQGYKRFRVNGGHKSSTVTVKPVPTRPGMAPLPGHEFMGMQLARAAGLVSISALQDAQLSRTLAMAVGDASAEAAITPFDGAQPVHITLQVRGACDRQRAAASQVQGVRAAWL